jgi:hypothetical protein
MCFGAAGFVCLFEALVSACFNWCLDVVLVDV